VLNQFVAAVGRPKTHQPRMDSSMQHEQPMTAHWGTWAGYHTCSMHTGRQRQFLQAENTAQLTALLQALPAKTVF
jgi:hypothetical protein